MKLDDWTMSTFILFFSQIISFAQPQIHVDHAPGSGILVDAPAQMGIIVDSAQVGMQILNSEGTGLQTAFNAGNGVQILQSGAFGLWVDSTEMTGILITRSQDHGLKIFQADSNGIDISQVTGSGIRIVGAHQGIQISHVTDGVRINSPQNNGVTVISPYSNGLSVLGSGQNGAFIQNTEASGVEILNTGASGLRVREAGVDGVRVESPFATGVFVKESGAQGVLVQSPSSHGVHVKDAKGKGGFVVHPSLEGLHILGPGLEGITIDSAGADGIGINAPSDDGLTVTDAMDDGINIINPGGDGIHVNGAGSSAGLFITSPASTDPSVYITHSNDDELDLQIGGDAHVLADGHFEIQIDGDNAIDEAFFQIRNSSGSLPFVLGESGDLAIAGHLSKGSGSFKIDHPLDPKNKYLYHSFVESPDMMNIYNGNVILNKDGEASIQMPDWFEPLNRDFRYQLTPIGAAANLYIAQEIKDGIFRIGGGSNGLKVSWQVTGIRQDRYANAHRLKVEVEKEDDKKGTYLHPDVWMKNNL
ncbi:MAG: hypothetical protein KDC53_00970 [Saprospiraceae bacterium]|nr:hypothetical protein [Saprospiraceae bacterium]